MRRLILLLLCVAFLAFGGTSLLPAPAEDGRVVRVVDGDTLVVRVAGADERVRLLGIDTPERGECAFDRATRALERLVGGRRVELVGDRSQAERDRYDRRLAYVDTRGGLDAGEELVRQGWARVYVFDRPFDRLRRYRAAARRARAARRGLTVEC